MNQPVKTGEDFELVINDKEWEKVEATYHPTPEQQAVQRVVLPRGTFYMRQEFAVAYCARHGLLKGGQHGR